MGSTHVFKNVLIIIQTLREDQDGLFGFVSNVITKPEIMKQK